MTNSPRSTILPPAGENEGTPATARPPSAPPPLPTDLPHADPIAYLGTARHPLSTPPTILDLEPSRAPSAYSTPPHPRSHIAERIAMAALASLLVAPFFLGLSESTGSKNTGKSVSAVTGPVGVVKEALPTSVASLEGPPNPREGSTEEAPPVAAPPAELELPPLEIRSRPAAVEALRRAATEKPRHEPVTTLTTTAFDFGSAMNAVVGAEIGPIQCGPDAVGAVAVAVTFAPSGNATRAVIENGPLRGTDAGSCIATHLRDVTILPFEGELATVRTNLFLR